MRRVDYHRRQEPIRALIGLVLCLLLALGIIFVVDIHDLMVDDIEGLEENLPSKVYTTNERANVDDSRLEICKNGGSINMVELQGENKEASIQIVKSLLLMMEDSDRVEIFNSFCRHCGDNNPRCQCENDE